MKRFVSLVLSVCFLFSINTVSYAANTSSRKASNPVIQSMNDKYHVDFSGMSMEEIRFPHLHGLQRQRSQGRSVDEVLKHILSAKGHLQAADVPCYILKITIYRSDDTMVDKFSQVAGNVPVTNNDPNRRYTVINGYPVVLNFAKEPNPGVFERVRDILLATSYTKKTS